MASQPDPWARFRQSGPVQAPAPVAAPMPAYIPPPPERVQRDQLERRNLETGIGARQAAEARQASPQEAAVDRDLERRTRQAALDKAEAERRQRELAAQQPGGGVANNDQNLAAGFALRMATAGRRYDTLNPAAPGIGTGIMESILPRGLSNGLRSEERQTALTLENDFIAALLRKESGAAISEGEMESARARYFPQEGDSVATLNLKRDQRQQVIEAMMATTGPMRDWVQQRLAAEVPEGSNPGVQSVSGGVDLNLNIPNEDKDLRLSPERRQIIETAMQMGASGKSEAEVAEYLRQNGEDTANLHAVYEYHRRSPRAPWQYDEFASAPRVDISDVRSLEGGLGQRIDSIGRGAADTMSLGWGDEVAALGDTVFSGGTYQSNLDRQRAIDHFDEKNQTGTRLLGQIVGGVALPMGEATGAVGMARTGATYGAAYGFGSGDGDILTRLRSAGTNAIGGAIIAPAVGVPLQRLMSSSGPSAARLARNETYSAVDRLALNDHVMPATVGGPAVQMATGGIGRTFGGVPIARGAQRELAGLEEARNNVAARMGDVSDNAGAGQALQRGMRQFETQAEGRQAQLERAIPISPNHTAVTTATEGRLGELTAGFQSNPELGRLFQNNELQNMQQALSSGRLSWQDLRAFRSRVGEAIGSPQVISEGTSDKQLRSLYQAISQDMEATAGGVSDRALSLTRRAIQYGRGLNSRRETNMRAILGRNYSATAEDAFRGLLGMAKREGGDFAGLRRTMASLPQEEANTARATVFARLGRSTEETGARSFSADRLITEWGNLSPRSRDVLFQGQGHRQAVDDIVKVAAGVQRGQRYTNRSNTGLAVSAGGAMVGASTGHIPATIAYAAVSYGAGRILSSPTLARIVGSAARTGNVERLTRQLGQIALREPGVAQEATGLRTAIMKAVNDNTSRAPRAAGDQEDVRPNQQRNRTPAPWRPGDPIEGRR